MSFRLLPCPQSHHLGLLMETGYRWHQRRSGGPAVPVGGPCGRARPHDPGRGAAGAGQLEVVVGPPDDEDLGLDRALDVPACWRPGHRPRVPRAALGASAASACTASTSAAPTPPAPAPAPAASGPP